ncbi:hypothetical protein ACQKK5_11055 [Brevibacillus panacihumi]|uniref:hypothetical protein n=1 Tax=Brevibacillus panacihumi TaxID=497735 RepID=UPI003D03D62A
MYYVHPSSWYYPSSQSIQMQQDRMMPADMMEMMRQHMAMTTDIKRTVDMINERSRRMEEQMKRMESRMMM